MPKRITYLQARTDKNLDVFRAHWSTTHADIARELPGVSAYRQNHVLESSLEPKIDRPYLVDGIVELWFADEGVVQAGFASEVADKLIIDEPEFLSGLTGGPVTAGSAQTRWPYKLWLLARWNLAAEPDPCAVERWTRQQFEQYDGALGWGVNVLVPGAELLRRSALLSEAQIPEVAVAIGFSEEVLAREAVRGVELHLDSAPEALTTIHVYLAEELVII
ncbi:EthD family reductase [Arthrobacter sp. PAMC 25486]|uniref:EthD family reductase n=1 Tax=Arthrobacter sp. PAMC 25486 TaxID=1494608 RepID=UPI0009DD6269|nr:EthD family reductase [Arthrobacter sp. PAMC 25486]